MKRYLKTSSISALLVLIAAFTFSACSNNKNKPKTQPSDPQTYNSQSSINNSRSLNKKHTEILLGEVVNARTGQAVQNAKVTIVLSDNNRKKNNKHAQNVNASNKVTVTTNQFGLFMAKDIGKGDHVVKVMHNGYQSWSNTIYVPTLKKTNAAGPLNGFFMPSKNSNGWLHGVFHVSNNNNHPSNVFAKSLFITIGLQK